MAPQEKGSIIMTDGQSEACAANEYTGIQVGDTVRVKYGFLAGQVGKVVKLDGLQASVEFQSSYGTLFTNDGFCSDHLQLVLPAKPQPATCVQFDCDESLEDRVSQLEYQLARLATIDKHQSRTELADAYLASLKEVHQWREKVGYLTKERDEYKELHRHALEQVDRVFQYESRTIHDPILPGFAHVGEDKFEAVVRLAQAYKKLEAENTLLRSAIATGRARF
jgi:hypothetical protein